MAKYKIIPSARTIVQSPISIGHKAEKGVEAIEFDLTAWVETYGSGTLTVIMRRWGDAIPYPIALEIDENNKATWTLSDTDTAKAGMAYAQLSYIVGDEVVKKSDIYTFRVMDSLTGEGEPPEAYESWLEHLTHFAAEAMAEVLDIEGIVTDKTLTVDGGIADGKATGDALSALEDQFTEETDKLKADLYTQVTTGKMLSVGNSILTGSVWANGTFDHLVDYNNAPYGCVAKVLNLKRANVTHEMHSSSGLMYDSGTGSFLNAIKSKDISPYDFILTHLFQQDLNAINMGSLDSTAGDGTIVGGVKDLVSYINTNNSQCRLILVGVPPVNYQPTVTGSKVFTGKYANGYSIADADTLMLELASELNFTYISWQDMGLSYFYQNYTDGNNVHANNDMTYRAMGDYLGIALQYSYDSVLYQKRMKSIEDAETENGRGIGILEKTIFTDNSINIGVLTEGNTINPQTGANMSAANATRTTYVAFDSPVLINFTFDLSVYAYNIFTYLSSSISDVAENPTNGVWCDNSKILVDVPESQTPRFRIGVKRKDGVAMTTDVTDQDSDFYKIKNGIIVNKYFDINSQTDLNVLNSDNCIPKAGAGETTTYGVTITSNGAGVYRVKGTPTQSTVYNIYASTSVMPPKIKPGVTYKVRFRPSQRYGQLQISSYQNGEYTTLFNQNYDGSVMIPDNAEGMRIRLYFLNGYDNDYLVCPQMFVADSIGLLKNEDKPTLYPKMFTIIDDDGYGYYYRDLLPLCMEKNVSISSAIVANYIGEREGYMTWEQVEECYASGCEMLSHSLDHKTPEAIIEDVDTIEILEHKYRMAKHILRLHGIESKILVFNNSTGDMNVCQEAAKRVYSGAIHAAGSEINTPDSNPYYIKRFDFTAKSSGRDPFTYEQMKENVDLLVSADSGWLVWMIHTSSTGGWSSDEVSKIGRIIDYARENDILVTTVEHAMKVYYGI